MKLNLVYKILKNLLLSFNIIRLKYTINLKETFIMRKLVNIYMVMVLAISTVALSGCCQPKHHHEHGVSKVHHEHGDK